MRNNHTIPIAIGKSRRPNVGEDLLQNGTQHDAERRRFTSAQLLKRAFRFEYRYADAFRQAEPSAYEPYGKYRDDKAWEEIVDDLKTQGIEDPIAYVRRLFHFLRKSMVFPNGMVAERREIPQENGEVKVIESRSLRPPRPKTLASSEMIGNYRMALKNGREDAAVELFSAKKRARTEAIVAARNDNLDGEQAVRRVLNDPFGSYSPLFRYALAYQMIKEPPGSEEEECWNQRFREMAREYEQPAYIQYYGNPEGYSQWDEYLPQGFAQRAREFYLKLIASGEDEE